MSRPPNNPTAHLRLVSTPEKGCVLQCLHCAYEKLMVFPMTISHTVKLFKAFETLHLDCKVKP